MAIRNVSSLNNSDKFLMIAEDDLDDQELLREALLTIDRSLHIEFLTNGKRLIESLENLATAQLPQIIILDYNIPQMNGVEVLKILNIDERYKHIPKLIWSTSSSYLNKTLSLQNGATDYIVKPSDFGSFKKIASFILSFIL